MLNRERRSSIHLAVRNDSSLSLYPMLESSSLYNRRKNSQIWKIPIKIVKNRSRSWRLNNPWSQSISVRRTLSDFHDLWLTNQNVSIEMYTGENEFKKLFSSLMLKESPKNNSQENNSVSDESSSSKLFAI